MTSSARAGADGSRVSRKVARARLARQKEMIIGIDIGVQGAVAVLDQSGAFSNRQRSSVGRPQR
jgi:hypothetical protein